MDPAPFSVEPPPPPSPPFHGAGPVSAPRPAAPPPSGWHVVRPFVAAAAVLVCLALPPEGAVAQAAIALAFAAVLASLWPLGREPSLGLARGLLVVGGLVGAVSPLLYANPYFGIDSTDWLWTYWSGSGAWTPRADILLWVVVSVLALVAGLRARRTWLDAAVVAGVVLLAARGQAKDGPLTLVRLERVNLLWTASATVLGGGLLHLASASPARRGVARLLALTGTIGIVAVYAGWFPPEGEGLHSALEYYLNEIPMLLAATVGGAEREGAYAVALGEQLWAVGVPFLAQVAALACALLVVVWPSRARARPLRWLAALGVLALVLTWIVPPRAGLWFRSDEVAARGASRVAQTVAEAFMKAGLSLWLAGVGGLALLLAARPVADAGAPASPPAPVGRRGWAALFALATATALLVLWTDFHRDHGQVVRATVADVLSAGRWDRPTAVLAFEGGFALVALVAAFARPRRGLVGLALVVSALATGFLASPEHRSVGGVEVFVAPALGAAAAGAALGSAAGVRSARGFAVGAASLLLLLLLYPTQQPPVVDGTPPYRTLLWDDAIAPVVAAADLPEALSLLAGPGRVHALGLALTAVLAALAAATRARPVATAAASVFVLGAVVAPVVLTAGGWASGGPPADALDAVLRVGMTARSMLVGPVVGLTAAWAAVGRVAGGVRPLRAPGGYPGG